jgi:hypothetical protein
MLSDTHSRSESALLRGFVVFITCFISYLIPQVNQVVNLVGAIAFANLGFILPALFHLTIFWSENSWGVVARNIAIAVIGFVGMCAGVADTIRNWN